MGEPARPGHALDHEAPSAGSSIAADATRATYRCDRRDDGVHVNLAIHLLRDKTLPMGPAAIYLDLLRSGPSATQSSHA